MIFVNPHAVYFDILMLFKRLFSNNLLLMLGIVHMYCENLQF